MRQILCVRFGERLAHRGATAKRLGEGDIIPVAEHTRKNIAVIKALGEHPSFECGLFSRSHLCDGLVRDHGGT